MATTPWKPDTGWAWVVMVTAFLSNIIIDGTHSAFGLFISELLRHFGTGRSTVAWTYSLLGGIMGLSGVCASVFINRFGARWTMVIGSVTATCGLLVSAYATHLWVLIVTVGLVAGCGFGLMHICPFVVIGDHFFRRRSLAMGFITSGSGIGSFIIPPMTSLLISACSWRVAMSVLAGIALNGVVIGGTFTPVPKSRVAPPGGGEERSRRLLDVSLLRRPSLLLHMLSCYLALTGIHVLIVFLPDFAKSKQVSQHSRALLISILGATSTVCRLAIGLISDRCSRASPTHLLAGCSLVGGGFAVGLSSVNSYPVMGLCAAGIGLSMGTMVTLMPLLVIKLQGVEHIADCFGFLSIACGLASLFGAPIAGGLYDTTGSYNLAFTLAGCSIIGSGLLALPMGCLAEFQFVGWCRLQQLDKPQENGANASHQLDSNVRQAAEVTDKLMAKENKDTDECLWSSEDVP